MKLSTWLAVLTIGQYLHTSLIYHGWNLPVRVPFDILHEDMIFVMYLIAWFIIKSIEEIKENNER